MSRWKNKISRELAAEEAGWLKVVMARLLTGEPLYLYNIHLALGPIWMPNGVGRLQAQCAALVGYGHPTKTEVLSDGHTYAYTLWRNCSRTRGYIPNADKPPLCFQHRDAWEVSVLWMNSKERGTGNDYPHSIEADRFKLQYHSHEERNEYLKLYLPEEKS